MKPQFISYAQKIQNNQVVSRHVDKQSANNELQTSKQNELKSNDFNFFNSQTYVIVTVDTSTLDKIQNGNATLSQINPHNICSVSEVNNLNKSEK
ncbi:hypothetical protein L3V82_07315 [Thiotrichales bacterium 19S3-7]|nr:hypothetical protein [Thiotrichales bacterium 19S3-7]MCF6801966.1 hypothetical protein [Thiotrichales bacterium 19S3-11]